MVDTKINSLKPTLKMEQFKPEFTKSEHKIYEYIISHPEQSIYHSLTELSEASGVAEATVLRFFRKLGYKGYQDFKFLLAQEISNVETPDDETYVERIRTNMVQAIENSYDMIDQKELEAVIKVIAQSDDVIIIGSGSSGIAGLDMQNRLLRIGKNVSVHTDPHFQVIRASSLSEKSVVIAISLTGGTKDIIDTVNIAKEKGATIVAITNYIKSPLTKLADHLLVSSVKESPLDSGSLVAKISQLYLIDLICTGLTLKNYDKAKEIKGIISKNIANKHY